MAEGLTLEEANRLLTARGGGLSLEEANRMLAEPDAVDPTADQRPMPAPATPGGVSLTFPRGLVRRPGMQPPPVDPTDRLFAEGVQTEGAGTAGERFRAGFGADPVDAARRLLSARFGRPVEVTRDQASGHVLFVNPETGQRTFFNQPGLDVGDVTGLAGELPAIVGGITGAVGGAVGGPVVGGVTGGTVAGGMAATAGAGPVASGLAAAVGTAAGVVTGPVGGAVAGEALGTWIGEFARLKAGQSMGATDPDLSDIDLLRRSMPAALAAAAGSAILSTAYRAYRTLTGRSGPTISLEEFERRWAESEARMQGSGTQATTGQALRGTEAGDALLSEQQRLARQPGAAGESVRERVREQVGAIEQRIGPDESAAPVGQALRRVSEYEADRAIGPIAQAGPAGEAVRASPQTVALRARAARAIDAVTAEGVDPRAAGASIRDGLERARQVFREDADSVYDALTAAAGDTRIGVRNLVDRARAWQDRINSRAVRSLSEEDRRLVDDIISRNVLRDEQGNIVGVRSVDYRALADDISAVRGALRDEHTGRGPTRNAELLADLRDGLIEDRVALLQRAGRDDLVAQFRQVEAWYRGEKDLLERGVVGRLFNTADPVNPRIADERVFRTIMADRNGAETVSSILSQRGFEAERETMRAAIRGRWQEEVIRDGRVDRQAHNRFMANEGRHLDLFFSPAEARAFRSPAEIQQLLTAREARDRALTDEFNQTAAGQIRSLRDTSQAFGMTWRANQPEPAIAINQALVRYARATGDSGPLEAYRAAARQEIRDSLLRVDSAASPTGQAQFNLTGFRDYLNSHATQIEQVLGRTYQQDLRQLERQVATVTAEPAQAISPEARAPAIRHLVRGYLGQFTTPGRLLTSALRIQQNTIDEAMARMVLDPEVLRQVLRRTQPITAQQFGRLAASGGLAGSALNEARE